MATTQLSNDDLTIATQRSIGPVVRANVAGQHQGESSKWFVVSEEPLPQRKHKSSKKKRQYSDNSA